jgi:hypothetical protein
MPSYGIWHHVVWHKSLFGERTASSFRKIQGTACTELQTLQKWDNFANVLLHKNMVNDINRWSRWTFIVLLENWIYNRDWHDKYESQLRP